MSDFNASLRELRTWLDQAQNQIDTGAVSFGGDPVDPVSTETDFLLSTYMNKGQDLSFDATYGADGYFRASDASDHNVPPSGWDQSHGRAWRAPLMNEWVMSGSSLVLDVAHPGTSSTNTWDLLVQCHSQEQIGYIHIDALSPVTELSVWSLTSTEAIFNAYYTSENALISDEGDFIRSVFYCPITIAALGLKITTAGGGICKVSLLGGQDTVTPPTPPEPPRITMYHYPNGPLSVPVPVVLPFSEAVDPPVEHLVAFPGGLYSTHGFLSFDDGATWTSASPNPKMIDYLGTSLFTSDYYEGHMLEDDPVPFWDPWSQKLIHMGIKVFTMDPSVGTWTEVSTSLGVPQTIGGIDWTTLLFDQGSGLFSAESELRVASPCVPTDGTSPPIFYAVGWSSSFLGSPFGPDRSAWLAQAYSGYNAVSRQGMFVSPTDTSYSSWEVVGVLNPPPGQRTDYPMLVQSIKQSASGYYYVSACNPRDDQQSHVVISTDLTTWTYAYWDYIETDQTLTAERVHKSIRTASPPGLFETNGVVWINDKQQGARIEEDVFYGGVYVPGFSLPYFYGGEILVSNSAGILFRNGQSLSGDTIPLGAIGWDGTDVGSPGPIGSFAAPLVVPPEYYNEPTNTEWRTWTADGHELYNNRPS